MRPVAAAAAVVATVAVGLGVPPSVAAASGRTLTAGVAEPRKCHDAPAAGRRGVDTLRVAVPSTGVVRVRLRPRSGADGDWDLAVFDSAGRLVAGSAGPSSAELADGQVTAGDTLTIQGCRYAGRNRTVDVVVSFHPDPVPPGAAAVRTAAPMQIVEVATPARADKAKLDRLGLRLDEHGTETSRAALLHGPADAEKLRRAGLAYTVKVSDVAAESARHRAADRRYADSTVRSDLPSGRTSYRRLPDYEYEMKELARRHPDLVRLVVLPHRTVEGRDMLALEITQNVTATADGKPVFLNTAAHHPPEWIAAEHAMEWAYDLVGSYTREARTRQLLSRSRAVVVPLVNPDGFAVSREAHRAEVVGGYPVDFTAYEFTRKNCSAASVPADLKGGICLQNPAANQIGVDLNRNYGGLWGGPGASAAWDDMYFRGPAPFSEPEVRNIRSLYTDRQVVTAVNNHSAANLIIRPPSLLAGEVSVDEGVAAELGARMRSHNGYHSVRGWQLYDTSGSAEDWAHGVGGTLSYTVEVGEWVGFESLHPEFTRHVDEYLGRGTAPGAGKGGNREVYYTMLAATLESRFHSTVTGTLPDGWTLTAQKRFSTPTSPVLQPDGTEAAPLHYTDRFRSSLRGTGGRFSWAVNPSTRPQMAGRGGRTPAAEPQAALSLANPAGQTPVDPGEPLQSAREEVPFTVTGMPRHDNGFARVRIEWTDPGTDYDLHVLDPDGHVVGMSVNGYQDMPFEEATLIDPPPGVYRAVIQKVAGTDGSDSGDWGNGTVTFASPRLGAPGVTESWTLTCHRPGGAVTAARQVEVARGATVDVGDVCRRR
jgi:hypothetical protein